MEFILRRARLIVDYVKTYKSQLIAKYGHNSVVSVQFLLMHLFPNFRGRIFARSGITRPQEPFQID